MEKLKNIIKKLTLEIETNSMEKGLQIKDDINRFVELHIYPELNEYLDANIPENELWRIENLKLEIDLDSSESIKDISPIIISKIAPELSKTKVQNNTFERPNIEVSTAQKSNAKAFFEFLKTGRYPWWLQATTPIPISDIQLMKKSDFRSKIRDAMKSTTTLYRLVHQFDYQYIGKLFYLFYNEENTIRPIHRFSFDSIIDKSLKTKFWSAVFEHNKDAVLTVFEAVIRSKAKVVTIPIQPKNAQKIKALFIPNKTKNSLFDLLRFCNENLAIPIRISESKSSKNTFKFELVSSTKSAMESNEKTAKIIALKRDDSGLGNKDKSALNSSEKSEFEKGLFFECSKSVSEEKITQNSIESWPEAGAENELKIQEFEQQTITEEGTLLGNAGLVLLHPFLKHFFINMELLDDKKIRPGKQDLAAHLLHYVATKNLQPYEHELAFEKYLCDIPIMQPVDRFIKLTKSQKDSCDELLEAVLKHWSGLRTNAIDALRSEFLMREGKLTLKDEAHKLFVPRRTQDILLDTLPWNLQLVKLPWKKDMLYVEW